jgi:hypothetical protein
VTAETAENGEVRIELTAFGEGTHTFTVRADNLDVNQPSKSLTLRPGNTGRIQWSATMSSTEAPWVAVVIPDGDVMKRRDVVGSIARFKVPER